MYGLLYECKFLTIEETNKKKILLGEDFLSHLPSQDSPWMRNCSDKFIFTKTNQR